jgi:hypothetical protein
LASTAARARTSSNSMRRRLVPMGECQSLQSRDINKCLKVSLEGTPMLHRTRRRRADARPPTSCWCLGLQLHGSLGRKVR